MYLYPINQITLLVAKSSRKPTPTIEFNVPALFLHPSCTFLYIAVPSKSLSIFVIWVLWIDGGFALPEFVLRIIWSNKLYNEITVMHLRYSVRRQVRTSEETDAYCINKELGAANKSRLLTAVVLVITRGIG